MTTSTLPGALSRRVSFAVLGLLTLGGVSTTVAGPVEMPNRKPGLWEMKMTRAGSASPHMVTQNCVGEISDKRSVVDWTKPIEGCSKNDTQRIATGYIRDSICTVGSMTTTSHMEITGDFDSTYTVKPLFIAKAVRTPFRVKP